MQHKILHILAIAALLLASCTQTPSSARSKDQGTQGSAAGETASGGLGSGIADASDPNGASATGGSGSGESGVGSGQSGSSAPAALKCERYRDCIVARVNDQMDWKCNNISPQETCHVPFYGFYHLASDMTGSVVFVAYHNGSSTPAYEQAIQIPPLPLRGNFGTTTRFLYKNDPGVSWVTFQGLLKNSKGEVVGRGAPYAFPAVP